MTLRIAVIGGGFGGLEAAFSLKELLKPPYELTLVDRSAFHVFVPSIHEMISGRVTAESIRIPFTTMLDAAGIRFIHDEVRSLVPERREIALRNGTLHYDYLIVSIGAENNFFNVPGAEEFAYRFRTLENAVSIKTALLRLLNDPVVPCRIVLAGGGTEGVEVAGEILDLIRDQGREDDLRSGRISLDLIEGKERLLAGFPEEARDIAERYLGERGVTILANHPIVEVTKDRVALDTGEQRQASILIWTGGIQPSSLIRGVALPKDPGGWLKVTDRLHSPGDERVYAVGDAVSIHRPTGPMSLQRLAYHAQDQARVAALNISSGIGDPDRLAAYTPKRKPQLISLGKDMGICTEGERVWSGSWVVALKKAVERKHLMSCLTRPVSLALWSRLPGRGFLQRMRMRMPV